MKNKSLLASLVIVGTLVAIYTYAANARTVQQPVVRSSQGATSFEYAELIIEADGRYTWSPSGTNNVPKTGSLQYLYGRLGGNQRPTFMNLVGQLGADRWEMITINESTWTFKRTR